MLNEILWLALYLSNFIFVILAYKFWKREGLYIWIAIAIIAANIQVLKTIELFGFVFVLGNITYSSIFLATDILNERYGKKEATRGVYYGFFAMVAFTAIMFLTLQFSPHESDFSQSSLETIFSLLPRIAIASVIAFFISNLHDVWSYDKIKTATKGKKLWLRNNLSTMGSQLLDTAIFTLIAYYGIFETSIMIQIFLTTYIFKLLIALADTPFLYYAKSLK